MLSYQEQKSVAYMLNLNSSAISNEEVVNQYRKLTDPEFLLKVKKALSNKSFQYMNHIEDHYNSIVNKKKSDKA